MNILFASIGNKLSEVAKGFEKYDYTIIEYDLDHFIDEPELMKLINWADKVYCVNENERKLLSFMKAFENKIFIIGHNYIPN